MAGGANAGKRALLLLEAGQSGCPMRVIRGKQALVTGAASGIGRAITLALAREGAAVYLLDINSDGLAEVASEAREFGVEAVAERCDVGSREEVSAAVRNLLRQWGTLDILVNNAGLAYYGPTLNMTVDQWDRILQVNLYAPLQFTRELMPTLMARPEAHVLNVASICGLVAGGRFLAYHVSKFGLVGFSEGLRMEFARHGVGVSVLCPGVVSTNFFRTTPCGSRRKSTPTPPRWISTTPERCAAKAIRAIYRNKPLVLVTPLAYLLYYIKRFAPGLFEVVNGVERWKGRKKKLAATDKPGTLPLPEMNPVRTESLRRAA